MKVLVACEESQEVCKAFRNKGHEAYSCDIQDCSGGHPEWHIKGDVLEQLEKEWDMIIAFPPCTYLSNAGAARLYPQSGMIDEARYKKGLEGKDFFMQLLNNKCPKICVENPVQSSVFNIPKYTQIIQPWEHGHPYSKKTCLWLKGLDELQPSKIHKGDILSWVSGGSKDKNGNERKNKGMKHRDSKTKSKTFTGIAKAMADQWSVPQKQLTLF